MATFKTLGLADGVIDALAQQAITAPTDIQQQAYPLLLAGRDAWLSAPTGSGKTLAYLLPLLQRIDRATTELQLAILSPTQELAVQIHACIGLLAAAHTPALRSQLLIGNASAQRQKDKLKKKPHVVVGTSGRMLELGTQRKLKLHLCRSVVIDEADNLLGEDSIEEVEALLKMTPRDRQVIFTSATDKGRAFQLAQTIGRELQWLQAEPARTPASLRHFVAEARFHNKAKVLAQLLETLQPERAIVFVHRNASAEELAEELERRQLEIRVLHGGLSKFERQNALELFRRGNVRVLVASDVAARGLDIQGVSHVFNIDLPSDSGDYLHRAGRCGRMGAPGQAISIATEEEMKLIRRYQRDLDIVIEAR